MLKKIGMLVLFSTLAVGCASVPLETTQINKVAKQFDPPSDGKAGLYIYRNTFYGGVAHTDVMIDGYCIGSSAPYVFFYEEVEGDKSYKVSTKFDWEESPDPDNDLLIKVKSGKNYFFQQYLRMIGGTGVDLVDEGQGKEEVSKLDMAAKVGCGRMHSNKPSLAEIGQAIKGVSEAVTSFNEGMQAIDRSPRPKTSSGYKPPSGYKPSTSGYRSSTGRTYQYDLSDPRQRALYGADPRAKLRDRIEPDVLRKNDQNMGQYGGGILNKNKGAQWQSVPFD
jgi:hypothetical protein